MIQPLLTLNGARQALLLSRHMSTPDGSPLYAYRFEASEFEGVRELLRAHGAKALRDPAGGALLVMYLAEWFRRERDGGGWDWVTPLGRIGVSYHPTAAWADVRYTEVRDWVEAGLRSWRRPIPPRRSLLATIVQESGFPAADVAKGRLGTWLRRAILTAERGLNTYDAVSAEAWRAPETLARVLFPSVVKLCEAIIRLRKKVSGTPGDAVTALDLDEPSWRDTLPFDVRDDHFRHLVEELVVARPSQDTALRVHRGYVLSDDVWTGRAELRLDGEIDEARAPPHLLAGLADYSRARVYPRGEAARWTSPIAALEREPDENGGERWHLRPLVARYAPPLDLHQEVRLAVEAGVRQVAEFVPLGGEPLVGPVISLMLADTDDPLRARSLDVLGESPVSTTRPWLVLALSDRGAAEVSVEGEHFYLAQRARDGRHLMAFSGVARLSVDGVALVWRTKASVESADRLVLIGPQVPNIKEPIFRGPPTAWIDRDGRMISVRASDVCWKPVGSGTWQSISHTSPVGSVYLAVRKEGKISVMSRAAVAPGGFRLHRDRSARRFHADGLAGANVKAFVDHSPLATVATASGIAVQVDHLPPGRPLRMTLTWEASLDLSMDDPLALPMLLAEDGAEAPSRACLTLSRLRGFRLLSHETNEIMFEGRAPSATPIQIVRRVSGSMPLAAFEQVLEELLGAFDSLDASVRLSWANRGDWFAEVRRWETRQALQAARPDSVFAVLANRNTPRRRAVSLQAPSAGCLANLVENDPGSLADALRRDLAPGPWLLTGATPDGAILRPAVLPDSTTISVQSDQIASVLALAKAVDQGGMQLSAGPASANREELRWLIDLCLAAKSIESPYVAVDALRILSRSFRLAPAVLAICRTPEERYAVLDLQGSLPFMWCLTEISMWQSAFGAAHAALRDQFTAAEIDDPSRTAAAAVSRGLGQIVDALPILSTHARLSLHELRDLATTDIPYSLSRRPQRDDLSSIAQSLVTRRLDDGIVSLPRLSDLAGVQAELCRRFGYDQRFAEVLAAPIVAARSAAGRLVPDLKITAACRAAWTWDREYFEDAFRAALLVEAQAPVLEGVK